MENKIRLIAVDLDGTLLNRKKEISARTKAALAACAERGIIVMPATGRPATGFPYVAAEMPGFRYALTSNGALVYDFQEKKAIFEDLLSVENTLRVIDFAADYDLMVDVYTDGNGYSEQRNLDNIRHFFFAEGMIEYVLKTRIPVENMRDFVISRGRPVEKIVLFLSDVSFKPELEKLLEVFPFLKVTDALENNLELNNVTANKGASLLRFGEAFGIAREQIMAFGDGRNDCDMIRAAGIGVAMANACAELKACADMETLSNEEDGVAVAIEQYALAE
ncbi:MAG: Cof-type HAD-IIB family hydrolase [Clostridiaceae bacterium]|nr:Cof-type HAD-IIB family hydrolase [Clostridiaceae bacterium]